MCSLLDFVTLIGKAHINTKAFGEATIGNILGASRLTMDMTLVKSNQNQADCLTRVPQRWFKLHRKESPCSCYGDQIGHKSNC